VSLLGLWRRIDFKLELLVGISGLVLSVVLHELFHILVHSGNVLGVGLFTNPQTIAEVVVRYRPEHDLVAEEFMAYTITSIVLLITVVVICKISDRSDTKAVSEILFARDQSASQISRTEMIDLAQRTGLI